MKNKLYLLITLLVSFSIAAQSNAPVIAGPTPPPSNVFLPIVTQNPPPVHAVRADFKDMAASRNEIATVEQKMKSVGANMVGLTAGRVEWAYFKWNGMDSNIANDVKDTGIDFLADDTARFKKWAHVNAVVDVLSPNYLKAHPEKAAVNFLGQPSVNLVSTAELINGEYGRQLLAMVEYISANYPVDSISVTELFYHRDGYGEDDKALYMAATGRTDWPRLANGQINPDDVSVGNWRTGVLDIYLDKLVQAAHQHGKQFFFDVDVVPFDLANETNNHGTNYHVMLEHIDRLIIWGYFHLDNYPAQQFETISRFMLQYGTNRVIVSLGLWDLDSPAVPASSVKEAMLAAHKGGMDNIWITPGILMNEDHWKVLKELWTGQTTP